MGGGGGKTHSCTWVRGSEALLQRPKHTSTSASEVLHAMLAIAVWWAGV